MASPNDVTLSRLSELASTLRGADLRGIPGERLTELLHEVLAHYYIQVSTYDHRQVCFRARLCSDPSGFSNVHQCLNPPKGTPNFGRASTPGDPVLYSSWNIPTALDEIGAAPGDYVHLVAFNVVPGYQVKIAKIGDLQRRYTTGRPLFPDLPNQLMDFRKWQSEDPLGFLRALYVDALLAELFTASSGKHFEFRVTAGFAATIYDKDLALLYPSVRTPHAMNISMRRALFDQRCQVIFTEVVRIDQFHGYSIYEFEFLRGSNGFSSDGTIDWSIQTLPKPNLNEYGTIQSPETLHGWRPLPNSGEG